MLLGSSILQSTFRHHRLKTDHTLGDIVRHAHAASFLSEDAWNKLPPIERELRLVRAAYTFLEIAP